MRATELDWNLVRRFHPREWPDGVLDHMHASIILALAAVRDRLPADHAMHPSPVPGAHVRDRTSGSRHSTRGGERLSDATDLYMLWRHVWAAYALALRSPSIGGLGIYTDMLWDGEQGKLAMMHFDTRPERIMWVGWRETPDDPMQYVYWHDNPLDFCRVLAERGRNE